MSKRFIFFSLILFVASSQTVFSAQVFKIATIAPDSTTWMKKMRNGAEQISQRTEDRVKLKFYFGWNIFI